MTHFKLLDISLHLFDGAAAAGGAAAPGDGSGAQAGTQAPGSSRRGRSGGLDNVVYGKQSPTGDAGTEPDEKHKNDSAAGSEQGKPLSHEERRAKYREMIASEEFKDIHTEEFQKAFDRRHRDHKTMQEQFEAQRPVIDSLMAKYKIENGDMGALQKALESDHDLWASVAEENGMTVEQYNEVQRLRRENEAFKAAQKSAEKQEMMRNQLMRWNDEAKEVAAEYPDFDLAKESKDPEFVKLLQSGVPVRTAYEVRHLTDIKGNVARKVEDQVVNGIKTRGARPVENGAVSQSGKVIKADPSKYSRRDRAEIARLVSQGEEIYL